MQRLQRDINEAAEEMGANVICGARYHVEGIAVTKPPRQSHGGQSNPIKPSWQTDCKFYIFFEGTGQFYDYDRERVKLCRPYLNPSAISTNQTET